MTTEALVTSRRVQKILNDNVRESNEDNNTHIVHQHQGDASAKRLPKNQRTSDSTRLLLLTENAQESSEKDFLFAQRFIERVEETFINENKHHKFSEFLSILRKFNENQQRKSGADLYVILEKFLLPDYPEIIDLFLNFLLPSDAVEINKSMEYFLKVNLSKFLIKLNIFFQKQPAQIRKVLTCLKELSDDPDVTFDRLRSRVLPLLKGNQLLIDWFLQCVGPDKCESNKDEFETLVLRKGNESFDDDQFEYIPQSEVAPDPNDNPCNIRYMNGSLFFSSRFPSPAKLSFGAVPCASATVDMLDNTDKQILMGSIDKSLQYRCVHNIKEFADSKMRDRHHWELEHIGNNGTSEEIDNSDDEQNYQAPSVDKNDERNGIDDDHVNTIINDNVLCDNILLRAHSIRLNPSIHSTSLIHSNAEILNKLNKPAEQLSSDHINKDPKLSPKKQPAAKFATNTQAKPSNVRKTTSPNTKKMTSTACKSPNNKKTTSPTLSGVPNMENSYSFQTIQESNAIQTAKKLKRILESSTSGHSNQADDTLKRTSSKTKSQKSHMLSKPIKKQKRAHEYYDSGDDEEVVEKKKDETKPQFDTNVAKMSLRPAEIQWTREEDRLLLEQIKAGVDSNTGNIAEFADDFTNKTPDQIRNRIRFLIDFLTKLRNKNN